MEAEYLKVKAILEANNVRDYLIAREIQIDDDGEMTNKLVKIRWLGGKRYKRNMIDTWERAKHLYMGESPADS